MSLRKVFFWAGLCAAAARPLSAQQASTASLSGAPPSASTAPIAAPGMSLPALPTQPPTASTAAAVAPALPPAPSTAAPAVPLPPPETRVPAIQAFTSDFGTLLDPDKGPWALGDVRFIGNRAISEYALQSKVRAKRGSLYMPEDVKGDVATLLKTGSFDSVRYSVYAIAEEAVPEGYGGIAVSTHMVRLVFEVSEKAGFSTAVPTPPPPPPTVSTGPAKLGPAPPAAISGVVFTPTAYRGLGKFNQPGLGLDFNGIYYIGRLYGKNALPYTLEKTNYLDRIGQWLMMADGKMQLQSEDVLRPAVAAGAQGIFAFRDAPQPNINTPGVSAKVSQKSTHLLTDGYVVVSKKFWFIRSSVGYMEGNAPEFISLLSEFLSPEALLFSGHPGQEAKAKSMVFASLLSLPKPQYPLAVEFLKPTGMAFQPYLLNFKIGYFIHTNFDIAYLKFAGGYDLLGMIQFRVNYFPSR